MILYISPMVMNCLCLCENWCISLNANLH